MWLPFDIKACYFHFIAQLSVLSNKENVETQYIQNNVMISIPTLDLVYLTCGMCSVFSFCDDKITPVRTKPEISLILLIPSTRLVFKNLEDASEGSQRHVETLGTFAQILKYFVFFK